MSEFKDLLLYIGDLSNVMVKSVETKSFLDKNYVISKEARHEVEEALLHLNRAVYFLKEGRSSIRDRKKP